MASIKNMLLDDDEEYSIPEADDQSFTNEQEFRPQEEPQFSPEEVKPSQIEFISSSLPKTQSQKGEEKSNSVEMKKDVKLNRMSMIEEEFEECLDESGGILEVASVLKLIEFMKEEKNSKERIYLLEILSNTCHTAALSRFVQLEGVQILADWVRELTPDSAGWKDESDKEVLSICLNALNSLPMSKTVLKATLIGKAVHKLEQSPIGDQKGIKSKSRSIVAKWRELTQKQKNPENKSDSPSHQEPSQQSSYKNNEDDLSEVQSKDSTIMALLAQTESSDKIGGTKRPRFDDDDPFEIAHMPEKRRRLDMDLQGNITEMEIYESRGPKIRMKGGILKVVGEPNRRKKQVKFRPNDDIENVKVFKMNDEPNARGLTREEMQMLQESLANVPAHRITAELKIMEMKFDKRRMSERKETEDRLKKKLEDMRPLVKWPSYLKKVSADGHNVARAEESLEVKTQKIRERTVMGVSYMKPQHIPLNPVVEMDEFYGNKKEVMDAVIKKDLELVVKQKREKEEEDKKQKEQKLAVGALIGKLVKVIEKIESGILSSEAAAMVGSGNEPNYNLINLIAKFAESKSKFSSNLQIKEWEVSSRHKGHKPTHFSNLRSVKISHSIILQESFNKGLKSLLRTLWAINRIIFKINNNNFNNNSSIKNIKPSPVDYSMDLKVVQEENIVISFMLKDLEDMPREVFMRIRNENMRLQAVGLPPNDDGPTEESEKSIRLAQSNQQQQQQSQGVSASSNSGQIGMMKIPPMGIPMQRPMGIPSNIGTSHTRPNLPQSFPGMFNGQKSQGEKKDDHSIPPQMMMSILQKNQLPPNGQVRMPNQFNHPMQQRPPMMGQNNQIQMGMNPHGINPMMQPGFRGPQQMGIRFPPNMMQRFPGPPPQLAQQRIGGQSNGIETIEDNDYE